VVVPVDDSSTPPSTLIRFGAAGGAERRLICLPFAGGGPATYRGWTTRLPADVEVVAVMLPGRDPSSRVRPPDSIGALVAATRAALAELHEREPVPFALFGHSMGALIGFELTVDLERSGGPAPTHLFVSGRRPPDEPHTGRRIHELDDESFLDAVQGRYGAIPDVVRNEPELLALLLPALRADVRAFETHVPLDRAVVRCPVHVYGGADDLHPGPAQLTAWQRVAASKISVRVFDGDHFYLTTSGPLSGGEALTSDIAARLTGASMERR
jgi:medium-chain acyl-[acyl-carrier-protein] hydrolase